METNEKEKEERQSIKHLAHHFFNEGKNGERD